MASMFPFELKVQKFTDNGTIPSRATDGSAGYDLYSAETLHIMTGGTSVKVNTDIGIQIISQHAPNNDTDVSAKIDRITICVLILVIPLLGITDNFHIEFKYMICFIGLIWGFFALSIKISGNSILDYCNFRSYPNNISHFGKIEERSSMAMKGIRVSGGIIDSDYRGSIGVILYNTGNEIFTINKGDRIAQLIIMTCIVPSKITEVTQLEQTQRGGQGFGSTGR